MENNATFQVIVQLGNKKRRQMKTHTFGVEETKAGVVVIESFNRNSLPIDFFIFETIRFSRCIIRIVINGISLNQSNAIAKRDILKCVTNFFGNTFLCKIHFVSRGFWINQSTAL